MVRAAAVADAGCKGGTLFRNRERSAEANSDTAPDGAQRKIPQLEAAIGALLAILESRLDRGELTGQDPIIALAREHIDQAVACGMERNFRKRLDAMIGGLTPAKPTQTPHVNGVLLTPDRPRIVAAGERRKAPQPAGLERRSGRESRRFKRFVAPVLLVWIAGSAFRTIDWSIGGLSLAGVHPALATGNEVLLRLRVDGLPGQAAFEDRAIVIRVDVALARATLRFKSGTSATLKVLELLSRTRITPMEVPS
jgi:hypothetical protein